MSKVFAYRSLKNAMVQKEVLGHAVPSREGVLLDYKEIDEGKDYHSIASEKGGKVIGKVLTVTNAELRKIDKWEDKYIRKEVQLEDGEKAFVYIYKENKKGESMEHKRVVKNGVEYKEFAGEVLNYDDKNLIIEHFISTELQDSVGDIMSADGMKARGNIVVLFQHGMDMKYGNEPIAKCLGLRVGVNKKGNKGIIARTQYFDTTKIDPSDFTGKRLYEKDKTGVMPNWSIGFNSTKEHPTAGGRVVDEWELHEYSKVAVGCNLEATSSASAPELKFIIKADNTPDGSVEIQLDEVDEFTCKDGVCTFSKGMKPYPNEHACRINDPGKYEKFRRKANARDHEGKKYDVIYGKVKGEDKWEEQAYRYPKGSWTADAASAHCKSHEGSFEAAKALEPDSSKPIGKVSHKRAHKALTALHKEMISDLKAAAEDENFVHHGAEKCAKAALEDFSDNAKWHVEKYIKAVTEMDPAEDFDTKAEYEIETKGHLAFANALKKEFGMMVEAIRSCKGKTDIKPKEEAEKVVADHEKAAAPYATEYIKEWYKKSKEKPEPKPADSDAAGNDTAKVLTIVQPPQQVLHIRESDSLHVNMSAEQVSSIVDKAMEKFRTITRREIDRATGKIVD
jgi:gamma-glutamylcyclotransferase (GGCT)/AIG2-like uncharacterized protein YtfP